MNKKDFIEELMKMTHDDIVNYIKINGKESKKVPPIVYLKPKNNKKLKIINT